MACAQQWSKCCKCCKCEHDILNLQENVGATNYTHHQKAVILDTADAGTERRRVTAFIGGIDVTTGRYDDAEHSLFRENHTTHSHDWMQHNVTGAVQECGGEASICTSTDIMPFCILRELASET